MHGDIAFFTQPIISGHAGSQAFARRREKMFTQYEKGFEESCKSGYFQDRARTTGQSGSKWNQVSGAYLDRPIKECKKEIKARKKNILYYEPCVPLRTARRNADTMALLSLSRWSLTGWNRNLKLIEKAMGKQAFLEACVDEYGGIRFSKDNVKVGYHVRLDKFGLAEVVGAVPQNITYRILTGGSKRMRLKAAYAEITEIVRAEENREMHSFTVGERFMAEQYICDGDSYRRNRVHITYEIIKATSATIPVETR